MDEKVIECQDEPACFHRVNRGGGAALIIYSIQAISWRFMCLPSILKEVIRAVFFFLWGKQLD